MPVLNHQWLRVLCYVLVAIALIFLSLFGWVLTLQVCRVYFSPVPRHLPWAGLRKDRFLPKLRATLRELSVNRTVIEQGYEEYSRHGKPFVLPQLFWPIVVLPPSQTRWITSQPESILSSESVHDDLIPVSYFVHGPDSAACHDFSIITRDLTRNIGRFTPVLLAEITKSCEREFDSDDWKEVEAARAMEKIAGDAVSKAVVGELAESKSYHDRLHAWGWGFGYCSLVFGLLCPKWLKPFVGRLMTPLMLSLRWRLGRILIPEIQRRTQKLRSSDTKGTKVDLMQCIIESAERESDPHAKDPNNILGRTILYNMFAQHTTQNTSGTVLFDLISYPTGQQVQSELIEEAREAMARISEDPYATRDMLKMDSTIRETMRLDTMTAKGIPKEVVKPGGVTTPDGLFLPQGCHVSTASTSCIMRDSEWYERGDEFVPLRFYDEANGNGEKQKGASQISESFLSFSLGKHACPGRFFAVQMMKLMLGHVLINYEFESLTERPEFKTFGDLTMPPSTKVKVRRRKQKAES